MARSLSTATALATSLAGGITLIVKRRGYSAAAAAAKAMGSRGTSVEEKPIAAWKMAEPSSAASTSAASSSWIPDPITGYYRPANRRVEVDAAEMRQMLLSRKH